MTIVKEYERDRKHENENTKMKISRRKELLLINEQQPEYRPPRLTL